MATKLLGMTWSHNRGYDPMVDFTYRQSIQFLRESDRFSEVDRSWLLGHSAATLYQIPWRETQRRVARLITEN